MTTILLIDDDPDFRQSLGDLLDDSGYEVIQAENGDQGIALYLSQANPIDLVVSDVLMNNGDGLKVVRELRQSDCNVKVMLLSGGGRNFDAKTYYRFIQGFGANDVLKKPVSAEEILNRIEKVLSQ